VVDTVVMSSEAAEAVAAMIASRAEERAQRHAGRESAAVSLAQFTADHKEAREHGLKERHRLKLARIPRQRRVVD